MGVHEKTSPNGDNPFKAPQKDTPAPKEQDKKFTFTSVMDNLSPDGIADVAHFGADGSIPEVVPLLEDRSADSGEIFEEVEDGNEQKATVVVDTSSNAEVRNVVADIQKTNNLLMRLYEPAEDGGLDLKTGTLPDGRGGEISIEDLHAQLVDQLSLSYEHSVMLAEKNTVPENAINATMIGLQRETEYHRDGVQSVVELLTEVGIFGPDLPATPEIVTAVLAQDIEMDSLIKEKFEDLAHHYDQLNKLEEQRSSLKLFQDAPSITHLEYGQFLQKFGMPNAAKEHYDLALRSSPRAARSEKVQTLGKDIKQDQEEYLREEITDRYIKNKENPFELIKLAKERLNENDSVGAKQALETARELAKNIRPEDVDRDIQRVTEDGKFDLAQLAAKLEYRKQNGTITPGQILMLAERERRLEYDVEVLNNYKLVKAKTDMAYASFLLNEDPAKNTERNRKQALEVLLSVRYDKLGRVAAAQEAEAFDANIEKALQGTNGNQVALEAFGQAMKKFSQLKESAADHAKSGDSNKAVAQALEAARTQAELARQLAERIDRKMADRNQKDIQDQLQRQIEIEMGRSEEERDEGKILLLKEIAKPPSEQSKEVVELLLENFKPRDERDEEQISLLESVIKDKDSLSDILSYYTVLTRMEFQKQALNQARLAVIEIDVAFGKGDNHPYTKDIENDPYGSGFTENLGQTPEGKDIWEQVKDSTRDLDWYESACQWFKGNAKDETIAIASGAGGFTVGTAVAGLTCWSGPGAVIAGGASGFATGAVIGSMLHSSLGDTVSPTSIAFNGLDGLSDGLAGAARNLAMRSGALALERWTGRAMIQGAGETLEAFKTAGVADKLRIAAGSRFGSAMLGSTASSAGYRFGHEGVNYYEGKHHGFNDYISSASTRVMSDIPGTTASVMLTTGLDKFVPVPAVGPRVQAFNEYMAAGPISIQLRGDSYHRPAFQRETLPELHVSEASEKL